MSEASALIQAIAGDLCPDEHSAVRVLDMALELEVDPLDYCAATLKLGEAHVMRRAANWAGLSFSPTIPPEFDRVLTPDRLDAMADTKLVSVTGTDRRAIYTAPRFLDVLRLRQQTFGAGRGPVVVTKLVLQDYLARSAAQALTDHSRQALARNWPFATAQLCLTRLARFGFIAALTVLIGLVLASPYLAQGWLLPFSICILIGPSLIRLAALRTPVRRRRRLRRPLNAELPIYSVLIPLRDEAAMVPQLFAAMRKLDYPALCRKRI